jgi:ABC-type lipoprotein release transport system permease subunit
MMGSGTRYALRSLARNGRRTLLSVLGLAFGAGIGLIALSWIGGLERMSIDAVVRGGVGHLRVAPAEWRVRRDEGLRLSSDEDLLAAVTSVEGVALAAPRARIGGLLGLGTRSAHVHLTGVDPAIEPRATRYVAEIAEGRYLTPEDEGAVVLGGAVVDRLDARLGDELVVSVVDPTGEVQSALLTIVGIVRTGSRAIDMTVAHVPLRDVEAVSGRPGLSEISIVLHDASELDAVAARIETAVAAHAGTGVADDVLSWLDISDGMRMKIESSQAFMNLAVGMVLLVVLLGVASAQLTAVLERRKEFAMLAALGMRGSSLVRIVVTEGVLLGLMGGLLAMAWTTPILHRWSTAGIDLLAMMPASEDGLAFSGVLIDRFYYPSFGAWVMPAALGMSLIATVLASLYPAWFASRTDPAAALRVDR